MTDSSLFRQETARRLAVVADKIVRTYLDRRFVWLNSLALPTYAVMRLTLDTLTRAVEFDRADLYVSFVRERVRDLLAQGVSPIAVLAMMDLLCEVVNTGLTPDQQRIVNPIFEQARLQSQTLVYVRVMGDVVIDGI